MHNSEAIAEVIWQLSSKEERIELIQAACAGPYSELERSVLLHLGDCPGCQRMFAEHWGEVLDGTSNEVVKKRIVKYLEEENAKID